MLNLNISNTLVAITAFLMDHEIQLACLIDRLGDSNLACFKPNNETISTCLLEPKNLYAHFSFSFQSCDVVFAIFCVYLLKGFVS